MKLWIMRERMEASSTLQKSIRENKNLNGFDYDSETWSTGTELETGCGAERDDAYGLRYENANEGESDNEEGLCCDENDSILNLEREKEEAESEFSLQELKERNEEHNNGVDYELEPALEPHEFSQDNNNNLSWYKNEDDSQFSLQEIDQESILEEEEEEEDEETESEFSLREDDFCCGEAEANFGEGLRTEEEFVHENVDVSRAEAWEREEPTQSLEFNQIDTTWCEGEIDHGGDIEGDNREDTSWNDEPHYIHFFGNSHGPQAYLR